DLLLVLRPHRPRHTATTDMYTLSLHDALPICVGVAVVETEDVVGETAPLAHFAEQARRHPAAEHRREELQCVTVRMLERVARHSDRKSTRLNSSHVAISYAVFCLKKKTPIATL